MKNHNLLLVVLLGSRVVGCGQLVAWDPVTQ